MVVLLPGLGSTAHSFDDFAAALSPGLRVLAVDPPAHGASSVGHTPLTVDGVADAVVGLMDSLGVARAHLLGHSIAGAVITRVAARHPDRVGKLVYLDATFDYGGVDERRMDSLAVPRPMPSGGFASPREGEAWARRFFYGTWTPALTADALARSRVPRDELRARAAAQADLLSDATRTPKEYRPIRAPALSIWAEKTRQSHFFWLPPSDTATMRRADAYLVARRQWELRGVERFRRDAPMAQVVSFPAHHAMFITAPERTLAEVRSFLLSATPTSPPPSR